MQIKLVITAPIIERLISRGAGIQGILGNIDNMRHSPYPPSFSRIAAKTMDPAIGASTCALGSHRWVENMGSFTRNPPISIIEHKLLIFSSLGIKNS
jgi:hypothetical protein